MGHAVSAQIPLENVRVLSATSPLQPHQKSSPLRPLHWAVLLAVSALLLLGCRTPATQIELFIDTDAPVDRAMQVEVFSFAGSVASSALQQRADGVSVGNLRLIRRADATGTFTAGGSIGVLPVQNAVDSAVTLWLRATIAPTPISPEIRLDRAARVSFVRGRRGTARVFLSLRCGDQSVGCLTTTAEQCTVSVRCREQGATCGDLGECVTPELPVSYPSTDGSVADASVAADPDATSGRPDAALDGVGSDAPSGCPLPGQQRCGGVCVDTTSSVENCGSCGASCPGIANGSPACVMGACDFVCSPGYIFSGGMCLVDDVGPRPVAPISLGDVSRLRPTFRWELPARFDGAWVELCRDRACTMPIETLRVVGSSARPTMDLPAGQVVFWRVRGTSRAGTSGASTSAVRSATWLFHVPIRDASTPVDTSFNPHLDLNGDGFDDLAVGITGAAPGGLTNAGAVALYYGNSMGISMTPTLTLGGVAAFDRFGASVASAGDVNGDGFGDLIVGAYAAEPGVVRDVGTATVFHGSATGITNVPALTLVGTTMSGLFGYSVASAGDVNSDGYGDVIVGAYAADFGGMVGVGTASVFHGSQAGLLTMPSQVLSGTSTTERFGQAVASAGDVNGDGFSDVIVGAPRVRSNGFITGGASFFVGSAMGVLPLSRRNVFGEAMTDDFGHSVAGAGDLNGDGLCEVAVGSPSADPSGLVDAGTVSVYAGSMAGFNTVPVIVLRGDADDSFGISLARAGDVNGDGYGDLIVGALLAGPAGRPDAGTANIFHGGAGGLRDAAASILVGAAQMDGFGIAVASLGDMDGDRFGEIVVGAYLADPLGRMDAGTASIFRGTMLGVANAPSLVLEGSATGHNFGTALGR